MRKLSVIALALFLFILLSILLSTLVYAQPSTGGGGGSGSGGSATNLAGGTANAVPYQSAPGVTTFLPQGTGVWYESAGAPFYTLTPALTSVNGTSATSSVTIQGGADAASNSVLGGILLRGGSQTGTGSTNSAGGGIDVSGGNNAGTSGTSQAGSVELEAGESTAGGQQGLMILGYQMTEGVGTVTQWNLQCYTSASRMTVLDCPANPTDFVGVTDYHSGSATEVHIPPSESPINASAPVTLYDTVCAGAAAGQVTDSGGTGPCSTGITVGRVIAVSGTWTLADGASFTASSTLPLVAMTNRSQLGQGDVPTAGTPPGWTITGGSGLSQVVTLPGSIGASSNCQTMNTSNSRCFTSSPYYGSPAGLTTTTTTATLANTATSIAVASCSTFAPGNGVLFGTPYGNSFIGTVATCTGTTMTLVSAVSGLSSSLSSGANVQHDETAALTAAIAALPTGGVIYGADGTYLLNGPLQDTGGANAVIPMPKLPNYIGNAVTIAIKGFELSAGTGNAGLVFQTSLNSGNLFGGYDSAAGGGYAGFTNVWLDLDKVQIVGPGNPSSTMVNGQYLLGLHLKDVIISTATNVIPTSGTGSGVIFPQISNNLSLWADNVTIVGYRNGAIIGEHTRIGSIFFSANINDMVPDAQGSGSTNSNGISISYAWCGPSTNCISAGSHKTPINIQVLDVEGATNGVVDASNLLYGRIDYNPLGGSCSSNLLASGGANLLAENLLCLSQTTYLKTLASGTAAFSSGTVASAGCTTLTNTTVTGSVGSIDPSCASGHACNKLNYDTPVALDTITGFVPSTSGTAWISVSQAAASAPVFKVCNNLSVGISVGSFTINWAVR